MTDPHHTNLPDSRRDVRRAHGEISVSLQLLTDKLSEARAAVTAGDLRRAQLILDRAIADVEAAKGYLNVARDEHRETDRPTVYTRRSPS